MHQFLAPILASILMGAAPQTDQPTGRTIVGAVSSRGQPAVGAKVWVQWLPTGRSEEFRFSKPVKADGDGRFSLNWPTDARPYVLVARDSDGRMGWQDIRHQFDLGTAPGSRIELNEVADTRGRLTDAQGAPLRQARVRVKHLMLSLEEIAQEFELPPELTNAFSVITDNDGRFVLKGVIANGRVIAQVEAPSFGSPRIVWPQNVACEARLEKAGSIRFRFDGVADPTKLTGFTWHAYGNLPDAASQVKVYGQFQLRGEGKDSLTLTNLTPGKYRLYANSDWKIPYLAPNPTELSVPIDAVGEVIIPMSAAAEVRGRVVDAKSQKAIPGVPIGFSKPNDQGQNQIFAWAETDGDGQFRAFVTPGNVGVLVSTYTHRFPDGYVPPPFDQQPEKATVAAGESHTFPDIALTPAVPLHGIVVDDTGQPLPWITVHTADTQQRLNTIAADADGRFRIGNLGPDEETALRARTATGTTDGAIHVNMEKQKGPVQLVISQANAFRLRGRVTDLEGKPQSDAKVRIEWQYRGVGRSARWGIGSVAGTLHTDSDGRFESIALWPGDEYRVQVQGAGNAKAESAMVKGVAGQTHDFGTIVLPQSAGRVSGMIVDSRNRPIKRARVFNNGDGPNPISTTSGDDGRFSLDGLFDGEVYVFAQKDGHRFTGKLTKTGEREVYVVMLDAIYTPPKNQPNPHAAEYAAAQKKLTLHLLEQMWALPDEILGGYRSNVLEGMARFDLARAHQWMKDRRERGEPGTEDGAALMQILKTAEAAPIADKDPVEALQLLRPLRGREAHRHLMEIGRKLRDIDPIKARLFAEEAATKALGMPGADCAQALSDAGDLIVQSGDLNAGRKRIIEAADLAQTLGLQGRDGAARGFVAARLAPFDLSRAKALAPSEPPLEANHWRAALADRLAATDVEQALKLLPDFREDRGFDSSNARRLIAHRLAKAGQSSEAMKLAEAIDDAWYRVATLAEIAVIVKEKEPGLARSLIERAADRILEHQDEFTSWSNFGGGSAQAAWIAYQAKRAGHPDLRSIVDRVLASRATAQHDSPQRIAEMHATTAMTLALTDPVTAKWLLNRAVPINRPATAELSAKRNWLFIIAFADPERAMGEVDRRIKNVQAKQSELRTTGLIELISVLAQTTEADVVRNLARYGNVAWPRGYDD